MLQFPPIVIAKAISTLWYSLCKIKIEDPAANAISSLEVILLNLTQSLHSDKHI